jgi:molybdenum cofactor cytidylyltransferase
VIRGLLLAAGASRRFGAPKLVQVLNGKPLIRWSAEVLAAAGVNDLAVVVPPRFDEIRAALDGLDLRWIVNPDPEAGIGASIAAGVSGLHQPAHAVLIALADEPHLDPAVIRRVIDEYRIGAGRAQIVVPTYRGVRGHPVVFDNLVFPELMELTGDRGASGVADRYPGRVRVIEMDRDKPADVDTPEALRVLQANAQFMASSSKTLKDDVTGPSSDTTSQIRALARARGRIAGALTVAMILLYFGFIILIAFGKEFLARKVVPGLSIGILLGALVIVISWLLTWFYVRWANTHYDAALDAIGKKSSPR